MKPTTFINDVSKGKIEKADITLVDEAHLLLSREDAYNNYVGDNHLKDIIQSSKVTIVVFDEKQFLKLKSYWSEDLFKKISKGAKVKTFELTDQFRMQADDEIVDWIDDFVSKKVRPIPDSSDDYELEVFDNAGDMFDLIKKKDKTHSLSRIVATFDYEHKKDGKEYYVEEIGFKGIWNTTGEKQTWAERTDTVKEVGSIYTVQCFDLNYIGVILGP